MSVALDRSSHGASCEYAGPVKPVLRRGMYVLGRVQAGAGDGIADGDLVGGGGDENRDGRDAADRDARSFVANCGGNVDDARSVLAQCRRGPPVAFALGERRDGHLRQQLSRPDRCRVDTLEELVCRDRSLDLLPAHRHRRPDGDHDRREVVRGVV